MWEGVYVGCLGHGNVYNPIDASANEVSAAINQVLDNELYGWTEVGNGRELRQPSAEYEPGTGMGAIEIEGPTRSWPLRSRPGGAV